MSTTISSEFMQCAYCLRLYNQVKTYNNLDSFRKHLNRKHDSGIKDHRDFARKTANCTGSVKVQDLQVPYTTDLVFTSKQTLKIGFQQSKYVSIKEVIDIPKGHVAVTKNLNNNVKRNIFVQQSTFTSEDKELFCVVSNLSPNENIDIIAGQEMFTLSFVLSTTTLYVK